MYHFFMNALRMQASQALLARAARMSAEPKAEDWYDDYTPPDPCAALDYTVQDGTAIIDVNGGLVSAQIPGWYCYGNLTYESLTSTIRAAVDNSEVRAVILRFNSPGGTVTGCAEAAAQIDTMSSEKPIIAHCQMADSAAYWLAAATNQIIVDPTGEVGSVGVILTHVDMSKMLEDWGLKVTHIFSGAHKADGSPYEPLNEGSRQRLQADMDYLRDAFVSSVAAYRGMSPASIQATEASTYIGALAVQNGLADSVSFFPDLLAEMPAITTQNQNYPSSAKERSMAKRNLKATSAEDNKPSDDKDENKDKPSADDKKDGEGEEDAADDKPKEDAEEDGEGEQKDDKEVDKKASAASERARIAKIVGSPEAKGREKLAQHLAFNTDMSPEAALGVMAASPAEASGGMSARMQGIQNPSIQPTAINESRAGNPLLEDMARRFPKK